MIAANYARVMSRSGTHIALLDQFCRACYGGGWILFRCCIPANQYIPQNNETDPMIAPVSVIPRLANIRLDVK